MGGNFGLATETRADTTSTQTQLEAIDSTASSTDNALLGAKLLSNTSTLSGNPTGWPPAAVDPKGWPRAVGDPKGWPPAAVNMATPGAGQKSDGEHTLEGKRVAADGSLTFATTECPVCYEASTSWIRFGCGHLLCPTCTLRQTRANLNRPNVTNSCPLCRNPIHTASYTRLPQTFTPRPRPSAPSAPTASHHQHACAPLLS